MIKIVTGKINSCKTTRMLDYYQRNNQGDGFVAKKIMQGNVVKAYNLLHLSKNKEIPYILREDIQTLEPIIYQIGPYRFLNSAFDYVEKEVDSLIKNHVEPIFLDEISLLELNNQGFHQVLKKLLAANLDLVLVIRSDLLKPITKKYGINDYQIIE